VTDLILLGLDGATWDVLNPLFERDRLPALQALVEDGRPGTLESTFPPITAPAWLSMATGQNPGKTGVFYFRNRTSPDSFEFESVGSEQFRGRSFWDVLAARGYSVGVFNFPMLYPPYELGDEGFVVSGLGSPEDETITAPAELRGELDDVTGGYEVKVPYADPKYRDRPGALESDLYTMIDKRTAAMEHLLDRRGPDVFFGIVSATDWAQHYFWRYHDPEHLSHDPETAREHGDAIGRIWEHVDETVERVATIAEREDATLLLVSDHGFGPVNRTFHSNGWLESEGFRVPTEQSTLQRLQTDYFPYLRRIAEPVVSAIPQLNDVAKSVGKSVRGSPSDAVDWDRSVAFAPKQNLTCGMIYMLSEDPTDREVVARALTELRDPDGDPLAVTVYDPSDLYEGPNLELAPDILFTVEDFACAVDPTYTVEDEFVTPGPPSAARSGGHRMNGIYCFAGSTVDPGDGAQRSLLDVAPTVLYALDEPIPEIMDGTPLTSAFVAGSRKTRTIRRDPLAELVDTEHETVTRNDGVEERLEDLGYI